MKINSVFNCIECLIYQTRLMGMCMGTNSLFCSSIQQSETMYYFEIVSRYLSEVMKACSIMTGLAFSIHRYIEPSNSKNKLLSAISNSSSKRKFIMMLIYGFVVSIPTFFDFSYSSHESVYDSPFMFSISSIKFESSFNTSSLDYIYRLKVYFYFVKFFFNDLLMLILNVIVDCFLVSSVKKNLKQKGENAIKLKHSNQFDSSPANRAKRSKEDKKRASIERKANAMIIINIFIYFICRLPELLSVFFFFYFNRLIMVSDSSEHLCVASSLCYLVSNSIEYLYMLSYLFNIILYYHFNSFFRKGFRNFFNIKKSGN